VRALWFGSIFASGLLLLRAAAGRSYPALVTYLIAALLRSFALLAITSRNTYFYVWLPTELILVAMRFTVAAEAYLLLTDRYRDMGRWRVGIPAAATALALVFLLATWRDSGTLAPWLTVVYGLLKASFLLQALGMLLAWFVAIVPVTRPRPVTVHYWLAMAYFYSQALPYAGVWAFGQESMALLTNLALIGSTVTQLAWAAVIRKPDPPATPPDDPGPLEELDVVRKASSLSAKRTIAP